MANGHPTWCETDENGVHRSRLWPTSRPGDRAVEVHAFLWASGPLLGVGLDFTTEGQRDTYHLDFGQARVLRHVLMRLLDLARRAGWVHTGRHVS